ncbi:hypothetical protein [Nonomuraea sp. NPDC049400]|uniref:hypothetical protein n=1 Tax=Nonomuraea sp. NPDC049400 TaxID=3364352 RepID=UPI0037B42710
MFVSADRPTLVKGLRDLADFLDANPKIPIPTFGTVTVHYFPTGTDEQIRAVIDRIADYLGSSINPADLKAGHYGTSISFGPATYNAVGILARARAQYAADASYRGCVTPDFVESPEALDDFGGSSATRRRGNLFARLWAFSRLWLSIQRRRGR